MRVRLSKMQSKFPFSWRIAVPEDVLIRDLDGESVVLNIRTEKYYGLDAVGTRMWAVLTEGDTVEAAFDKLLEEYDVERARLRSDLETFVSELVEHGLLVVHE